ncbi:MAG: rod shape-determining protein RodA [Clostridiales bacterium]|nr:rod shape-determining protein RodA [Clostridiales bacterium]
MKYFWKSVRRFIKEADMFLLSVCLICSIFGLLLILSATLSYSNTSRFIMVQGIGIILGIILFVLFSLIDIYDLSEYWKWILAFNILFIASTIFFGVDVGGNRSWLVIPGIKMSVQPAEVVKITYILLLAKQMYAQREHLSSIRSMLLLFGHLMIYVSLIWVSSGDMGMTIVYIFIFICMAFTAGVRLWWFLIAGAACVAVFPILWDSLGYYQKMRILVVLDDTLDPLGYGYQASRSKMAIGSGKLLGQGIFKGKQTQSGSLPAKQTDLIFAVAGEELGMIGAVAILVLLCIIIFRCLYIATKARNGMGALVCTGVAAMLIFQVFENIGMCIGLTPIIGITLPFFSYGGSSVMTMFAAMGLVSGVKMRPMPGWLKSSSS